jgi:hypothetical protein
MTKLFILGVPVALMAPPVMEYNVTTALILMVLGMGMILMYVVSK